MASRDKIRPTPPPRGPALVRPAIGVLLLALGGVADAGCVKKHHGPPPPMPPPPMPDPTGEPPMPPMPEPPMPDGPDGPDGPPIAPMPAPMPDPG